MFCVSGWSGSLPLFWEELLRVVFLFPSGSIPRSLLRRERRGEEIETVVRRTNPDLAARVEKLSVWNRLPEAWDIVNGVYVLHFEDEI